MARARKTRLTDAGIARLKPAAREYTVWDMRVPGLGVRVRPSGHRGYIYQCKVDGRAKRVTLGPAALRHRGWVVNHKKIKRLMREHALHSPGRRRFATTTDSDHDEPVFPDRSRDRDVDGPNQLWVADLTYIAILGGFVYLAAIMDAWSRRIVGYALGRRIDARLTLAALTTAISPPLALEALDCAACSTRTSGRTPSSGSHLCHSPGTTRNPMRWTLRPMTFSTVQPMASMPAPNTRQLAGGTRRTAKH